MVATGTKSYQNYIGGVWTDARGGETLENRNPANPSDVIGLFPRSTAEDVAAAVQAAQAAQALGEVYPSANPATMLYTVHVPLGVVAIITPWNFPVAIPLWKIAPALIYGNAVVFKPAELTPLTATKLVQILAEAGLPGGVLNLVMGSGSKIGPALTEAAGVTAISFTGTNAVGRGIQSAATRRGAKVQLELGGKNPVVVLDDADLDQAATLTVSGAMLSAGQKCTATSRAIVQRSVLD